MKKILLVYVLMLITFSLKCYSQKLREVRSNFFYTSTKWTRGNEIPSIYKFDFNSGENSLVMDSAYYFYRPNLGTVFGKKFTGDVFLTDTNFQHFEYLNISHFGHPNFTSDFTYLIYFNSYGDYPCCNYWGFPIIKDLKNGTEHRILNKEVNHPYVTFSDDNNYAFFVTSDDTLNCYDIANKKNNRICKLDSFSRAYDNEIIYYDLIYVNKFILIQQVNSSKLYFVDIKKKVLLKKIDLSYKFMNTGSDISLLDSLHLVYSLLDVNMKDSIIKSAVFISELDGMNEKQISPNDGYQYKICDACPYLSDNNFLLFRIYDLKNVYLTL